MVSLVSLVPKVADWPRAHSALWHVSAAANWAQHPNLLPHTVAVCPKEHLSSRVSIYVRDVRDVIIFLICMTAWHIYIYFSYLEQDSDWLFKVEADIESNALLGCYALSPEFGGQVWLTNYNKGSRLRTEKVGRMRVSSIRMKLFSRPKRKQPISSRVLKELWAGVWCYETKSTTSKLLPISRNCFRSYCARCSLTQRFGVRVVTFRVWCCDAKLSEGENRVTADKTCISSGVPFESALWYCFHFTITVSKNTSYLYICHWKCVKI